MLHVRKTGGTAVKAALAQAACPGNLQLMLHPHRVSLRDIPAGDDVFFFLRDPVARYVSGFESRRREGRPAHYHPWTAAERRAYERFPSAEELALGLASTDPQERTAAEQAMAALPHIRTHLSDWLGDERLVRERSDRIILIGWQETLETDFNRLAGLLGLAPETSLPTDEGSAHRSSVGDTRPQMSDAAAAIVRDWYASDYALIDVLVELGLTNRPT
jgi:hypothetical protein